MALTKGTAKQKKKREAHDFKVLRAHMFKNNNISFDIEIDGWIKIYNMLMVAVYEDGDKKREEPIDYFISYPSHKDDNGNYWNYCYFEILTPEKDAIEEQIEHLLDATEEKK